MRIFKYSWHPNVHQFLGLVVLFLLSVASVVVVQSAGRTTPVTFDDALRDYRGDEQAQADPDTPARETAAAEPGADAPGQSSEQGGEPTEPAGEPAGAAQAPGERPAAEPEPAAPEPGEQEPEAGAFTAPAPGVYRYAVDGGEWLNMPGANREYPEESFATVRRSSGCQWEFEHRVADEHVDRRLYCSQPGEFLFLEGETRVQFFGQSDGTRVVCDPPSVVLRVGDEPGSTHSGSCSSDDTQTNETITYLGRRDIAIGGVTVSAEHVHMDARISGRAQGTSRALIWVHPDTGLLLRAERKTDTTTNAFGGRVRYQEEATIQLAELEPRT